MKTVEAARGNWEQIFAHFKLPWKTGNRHIKCPICEKKKFRVTDLNNTGAYICTCSNGDGFKLLKEVTGLEFKDLARQVDELIGNTHETIEKPKPKRSTGFMDYWKALLPIKGTMAEKYINNRGVWYMPKGGCKFGKYLDKEYGREFDAIISVASDERGNPVMLHTTYLEDNHKAKVEKQKKMRTIQKGAENISIKLFPEYQDTLAIAEGVETALSVHQQFKLPCWATLNSGYMKKFKAPLGVRTLHIYADNDRNGAGLAAAIECGNKNILSNNDVEKVYIKWTHKRGDFNDYIFEPSQIQEYYLCR